jgi:tetratricopeptide (TPR) repeat protein
VAHDVFISYSHRDKPIADAVSNGLESAGIRCWMAPRDIVAGAQWAEAIIQAIQQSRGLVVILSSFSNASPQVLREVERAVNVGIPIVVFRVEDRKLSTALEYYLSVPHWLDALDGSLDEHIQKLAHDVGVLLDRTEPPEPVLVAPPPGPRMARWAHPRRSLFAVPILLGVVAAVVAVMATRSPPVTPMTGLLNFAVADFGQLDADGRSVPWDYGTRLSDSVSASLARELQGLPTLQGVVQMRHAGLGIVPGETPSARAEAARRLASELDAQLVIYGTLQAQGNQDVFVPEFFVSSLPGGEELLGAFQLGAPVATSRSPQSLPERLGLNETMRMRSQAVTLFSIGLTYLMVKQPASAVPYFEQARAALEGTDSGGQEVIQLFLGTGYKLRDQEGDLERAEQAYRAAATRNPDYARAYIGLGNVHYERFIRSAYADHTELEAAQAQYERAEQARLKPETALVEAKVRISLGNVYVTRAQLGDVERFAQAEQLFQSVVGEYQAGHAELADLASRAFLGLGIIAERGPGDCATALAYYGQVLALNRDDAALRRIAADRRDALQQTCPLSG